MDHASTRTEPNDARVGWAPVPFGDRYPTEPPSLVALHGDLAGAEVERLAVRLDALVDDGRPRVRVDLTDVAHMSVRAQVLLLAFARGMRLRGGELVLLGPRAALREQGRPLGLFAKIRTIETDDDWWSAYVRPPGD